MTSESGKLDFRNSACTALRRMAKVGVDPVGATAATTEAPVGLMLSALEPKIAEVAEPVPKAAAVIAAATCRWVSKGSPPVVSE
jgi:hypothetical protein